jgi:crossover junction endodeoxyribonuclease RuvC
MVRSMRILGIDPGSRILGYAVIDCDALRRLSYVECGVIEATRGETLERRLAEIGTGLEEVLAELSPTVVAAEDIFTAANARAALLLGQARGAALFVCGRAGLRVYAYAPAVVKQAVTGRGRAPKLQVARMVQVLCGLRRVPRADAADALAVAVAHAQMQPRIQPPILPRRVA